MVALLAGRTKETALLPPLPSLAHPDPRSNVQGLSYSSSVASATRARSSPRHPLHAAYTPTHSLLSMTSTASQGQGLGLAQGSGLGLGLRGQLALAPVLRGLLQPKEPRDDHTRGGKGRRGNAQTRGLGSGLPSIGSPGPSAVATGMSHSHSRNAQGHGVTRGLGSPSLSFSEDQGQGLGPGLGPGLGQGSTTSLFSGYMGYSVLTALPPPPDAQTQEPGSPERDPDKG